MEHHLKESLYLIQIKPNLQIFTEHLASARRTKMGNIWSLPFRHQERVIGREQVGKKLHYRVTSSSSFPPIGIVCSKLPAAPLGWNFLGDCIAYLLRCSICTCKNGVHLLTWSCVSYTSGHSALLPHTVVS